MSHVDLLAVKIVHVVIGLILQAIIGRLQLEQDLLGFLIPYGYTRARELNAFWIASS